MKIGFIPSELLCICKKIVDDYHRKNGFGNLAADIETDNNINTISRIPEAFAIYNSANNSFKIRKWCFLAGIGVGCLSVVIPWWSLSIIVVIFLADRILVYREKAARRVLSAVLLSLEIFANDFLGWGTAYPGARNEALTVTQDDPESPKSYWLDYYLPRRDDLDLAHLKAYAPPARDEHSALAPVKP